jgi:hypothetical protein
VREVPGSNPGAPTSFPKVLPLPIPTDLQLLEPWVPFKDSEPDRSRATGLAAELQTEVSLGHSLYATSATAVAHRKDCDDVLFEIDLHDKPLAMVHLMWNRGKELGPWLPRTKLFNNREDWVREAMLPDREDYAWADGTHSSHE